VLLGAKCQAGMSYYAKCLRLLQFLYLLLFLSSGYYCILFRKYHIDQYFCSGWCQELPEIIMSLVVGFLHTLNSNETICLVLLMSRKFILLFCSSSRETVSFGGFGSY
jgi:hypothetical protein